MGFVKSWVGFVLLASSLAGCAKLKAPFGTTAKTSGTAGPTLAGPEAIDAVRLEEADRIVEAAIARKGIPGGVLLVERGGKTVYLKAYGNRSVQPAVAAMTTDTIFDMASLSK